RHVLVFRPDSRAGPATAQRILDLHHRDRPHLRRRPDDEEHRLRRRRNREGHPEVAGCGSVQSASFAGRTVGPMEPLLVMKTASVLLAIAALGGLTLAVISFKRQPPAFLAMLHGFLA